MIKKISLIAVLALALVIALPLAALAAAPLPHLFYGTVQTSTGGPPFDAPPGTLISAWVGGVEKGNITVTVPGVYGNPPWFHLIVQNVSNGPLILFYIDGQQADQT